MAVTKTVEACPYIYFPDNPELNVERMYIYDLENNNALVAYCDFYIDRDADTTYFLFIYASKEYRGRWTEMVICPEVSNYFGTTNEVSMMITPDSQADVLALIENKKNNPEINKAKHILTGSLSTVIDLTESQ